jgi:four helix bundle protein
VTISSFEDLFVWQRSMALVQEVYRVTGQFPSDERYGLTAQLRRSSISVPSNIAEGHECGSTRGFMRHLAIAEGSLAEARTQLRIGSTLAYCSPAEIEPILIEMNEIKRMLYALRRSLHERQDS